MRLVLESFDLIAAVESHLTLPEAAMDLGCTPQQLEAYAEKAGLVLSKHQGRGASGSLIATYGEEQAERYRTGERYTTPEGEIDVAGKNPRIDLVIVGGESGPKAQASGRPS